MSEIEGKTVIVTGANNGIGKETARELARSGARVILACRNMETGRLARDEIIQETGNTKIFLKKIDLSSFESIRKFAEDVNKNESKLHVLVHNAGVWLHTREMSEDNLELTMATNHFGPFLLTHLLIDLLKKSAPSRIVIVSSISHHVGIINVNQPYYKSSILPLWNYFNSKFANVCFTRELSRRLEGTNVTANSVHPGMINSDIWYSLPFPVSWVVKLMNMLLFKTCSEGCQTIVYLATSSKVENVTGKYFANCKVAYMSSRAFNLAFCKKVWEWTEGIVHLRDSDPKI